LADCHGKAASSYRQQSRCPFILTADIDASATADWNDGLGFEPIGDTNSRFTGSLDGNGFSITGLTIKRENQNYVRLFAVVQNGGLRKIILTDMEITGRNNTGGLAGMVLLDDSQQSGVHQVTFDALNLASGIYFYRLQAEDQFLTQKITLIK